METVISSLKIRYIMYKTYARHSWLRFGSLSLVVCFLQIINE